MTAPPPGSIPHRGRMIVTLRRLGHGRCRDRRSACRCQDGLGGSYPDRSRSPLTSRAARGAQPLRATPRGRAAPHRCEEARPYRRRRPSRDRLPQRPGAGNRLGVRPHRHSTMRHGSPTSRYSTRPRPRSASCDEPLPISLPTGSPHGFLQGTPPSLVVARSSRLPDAQNRPAHQAPTTNAAGRAIFIRVLGWAYAIYGSSTEQTLTGWLRRTRRLPRPPTARDSEATTTA